MDDTGKKLLNLMFREGETVCVSPNKYGYHSIPLEAAMGDEKVILVPTEESCKKRNIPWDDKACEHVETSDLILAALNPIEGFREDRNCKAFRNFLMEMDVGPLKEQIAYIQKLGLPYSAAVFSGGKSIHFLVALEENLETEERWRHVNHWMLSILTLADQKCQNPSRSIRIPGAYREKDNPEKKQRLVEAKERIKFADLLAWLEKFPEAKPKPKEKRVVSTEVDFDKLKPWVVKALINGLDPRKGRNQQWFAIACDFALAGYTEDDTMDILSRYFQEDRDFKEREWKSAIKSGFKYIYANRG
jgi:hypothetical protein